LSFHHIRAPEGFWTGARPRNTEVHSFWYFVLKRLVESRNTTTSVCYVCQLPGRHQARTSLQLGCGQVPGFNFASAYQSAHPCRRLPAWTVFVSRAASDLAAGASLSSTTAAYQCGHRLLHILQWSNKLAPPPVPLEHTLSVKQCDT